MIRLRPESADLAYGDEDGRDLWSISLVVVTAEGPAAVPLASGTGAPAQGQGAGGVQVEVEWAARADGLVELALRLRPTLPVRLERVGLVLQPTPAGAGFLAPQARLLTLGGGGVAGTGAQAMAGLVHGPPCNGLGAIVQTADGARSFLVGLARPAPDFAQVSVGARHLELGFPAERTIAGLQEYRLLCGLAGDPLGLLEAYGDALGAFGRRVGERPTGWNSWDYYTASVTMEAIRAEMAAIHASPLRSRLKYLCIDMGWENRWGDWRPNRKFPDSWRAIAAEIRAAGFEPGIWTAPFQANTYLPLVRGRRDLFCRQADGSPVMAEGDGSCLLFDPTHPEVEALLLDWYGGMREAGFSLFKVDYVYRQYFDAIGAFADGGMGKAAAARRFAEIIRQAIGDEAHLLSCGLPFQAALGLADSARVTTDIHTFWGHVRNSAVQVGSAYWMSGRLWVNDPDFAVIRSAATSADEYLNPPHRRRPLTDPADFWMAGPEATFAELQTWLAVVFLSGGSLFLGDSIARLGQAGLAALLRLMEAPQVPAQPLDLFEHTPPRVWVQREGDRTWLGLFNWDDAPRAVGEITSLPVTEAGVEVWSGQHRRVSAGTVIPGHGALLVRC